jgi:hypothetical protein
MATQLAPNYRGPSTAGRQTSPGLASCKALALGEAGKMHTYLALEVGANNKHCRINGVFSSILFSRLRVRGRGRMRPHNGIRGVGMAVPVYMKCTHIHGPALWAGWRMGVRFFGFLVGGSGGCCCSVRWNYCVVYCYRRNAPAVQLHDVELFRTGIEGC